ncbi:MAG TPA: PQQ-binding-like beta-propeller repeat protein [Candidatus Saccharimonadales bacterium]|nr:PQQ-binding-like beta-propeller repeat protein [Candidatus Saccharimonadales bacterium]
MSFWVAAFRSWYLGVGVICGALTSAHPAFTQEPTVSKTDGSSSLLSLFPAATSLDEVTNVPAPGTVLWDAELGSLYAAPAVATDGTIYFVAGNPNSTLHAFTSEGVEKWRMPLGGFGASSPALGADGTIFIGIDMSLRAYAPDGSLLWSFAFPINQWFYFVSTPAIAHDGTVYVGTGWPDRGLYAFRPNGRMKWKFTASSEFAEVYTPIVGGDGTVYFGSYNDGFYAVNPDGTRRWYYQMPGYNISAAIDGDGTVYVVGSIFPNKLFAFTPDGTKKWETQIGPDLSQGSSAPVIGPDGTLYVACGHDLKLYAIDPDGFIKWSAFALGVVGGTSASPAVDAEGNVYTGFGTNFMAVNSSGVSLWSFTTNGLFTAPALTPEGVLYVGSAAGRAYAFQAGAGVAQSPWPMFQRDLRHTGAAPASELPTVQLLPRDPFAVEGISRSDDTNTASFLVRRHGSTNASLIVRYTISGTASNGVDYVTLPGTVTLPAGERNASILVVPIDDNEPEGIETVVLQLASSPDYVVGFPPRAAAIIVDKDQPRPPSVLLPDHRFHLCLPSFDGFGFRVEVSSDLRTWRPACTNIVTGDVLQFVDPEDDTPAARFYRVLPDLGLRLED